MFSLFKQKKGVTFFTQPQKYTPRTTYSFPSNAAQESLTRLLEFMKKNIKDPSVDSDP